MPYTIEEYLEEAIPRFIRNIPPRLILKEIPARELLKDIPREELLKDIPAEERLKGLSTDEIRRLQALLAEKLKESEPGE